MMAISIVSTDRQPDVISSRRRLRKRRGELAPVNVKERRVAGSGTLIEPSKLDDIIAGIGEIDVMEAGCDRCNGENRVGALERSGCVNDDRRPGCLKRVSVGYISIENADPEIGRREATAKRMRGGFKPRSERPQE